MRKIAIILLSVLTVSMFSGYSQKAEKSSTEPDIMQIRSICNLATLECYYHNVAKSEKPAGSGMAHWGEVDRRFWVEYTGIAKIGIDMSEVDMKIEGDKVSVFIPEAKLLSTSIHEKELNEESYIFSGDSWFNKNKITAEDQTSAINKAQTEMSETVMNNDTLLLSAQTRAQKLIENYIVQLGQLSNIEYKIEWVYDNNSNTQN